MSDFWGLSTGESATDTGTEYEVPGGGNFDPIPDGSTVLALIDEVEWKDVEGNEYLSLRWAVLKPEEYKNRKLFQKLYVTDPDPRVSDPTKASKKTDKARRMLAAIDCNAGGKLSKKAEKPTVEEMTQHLCNKPMVIRCMVWEMDDRDKPGEKIRGNWINAVGKKTNEIHITEAPAPRAKPTRQENDGWGAGGRPSADLDDEIPFSPEWRL